MHPLDGGGGATLYLVGRELCLFLAVDATKVPAKERGAYLALAVRQAAPYEDPAHDCSWIGNQAAVWYWSRTRALERLGQAPRVRSRFSAEARHLGSIHDDAVELLALHTGFEGRLWRKRHLVASRWWQQLPSPAEWSTFLRGAGFAAATDVPSPDAASLTERPWGESARGRSSAAQLRLSGLQAFVPKLSAGIALGAAILFTWQIGSTLRALYDGQQAEAASRQMEESIGRILAARVAADDASAQIGALLRLREGTPQHRLLAEVARLTEGSTARVRLWQQPHPDRLEITLALASPNPEALVTTWEASPVFGDVTAELSHQPGEVVIRATIQKDAP